MPDLKKRLTILALGAVAATLLVPATVHAATNFGSRLIDEPANAGECSMLGPCTLVSFIHPSEPEGNPYSGGAPVDGVITKFRIRAFAEGGNRNCHGYLPRRKHRAAQSGRRQLGVGDQRRHRPDGHRP